VVVTPGTATGSPGGRTTSVDGMPHDSQRSELLAVDQRRVDLPTAQRAPGCAPGGARQPSAVVANMGKARSPAALHGAVAVSGVRRRRAICLPSASRIQVAPMPTARATATTTSGGKPNEPSGNTPKWVRWIVSDADPTVVAAVATTRGTVSVGRNSNSSSPPTTMTLRSASAPKNVGTSTSVAATVVHRWTVVTAPP
jgi:hypothetical protein